MRPLTLHVSALNDAEYDLYTSCLYDLIDSGDDPNTAHDDHYYEHITIGVRELRAWLRGRYPELSATDLDSIFKLFQPSITPADSLTGGQFFAVMRLVAHVREGKSVNSTLVFVQAHPDSRPSKPQSPLQRHRSSPYPPKSPSTLRQASNNTSNSDPPFPDAGFSSRRSSESQPRPPQHPDTRTPAPREPPPVPLKPNNPFLTRRLRSVDRSEGSVEEKPDKIPPLPPRKPPPLLPPRNSSLLASTSASSSTSLKSSTLTVVPPSSAMKTAHSVTPLMRQSLEASKVGQTIRKMEEQLEKERVLQVVKSSSGSGTTRSRSISPNKGLRVENLSPVSSASSSSFGDGVKSAPAVPRRLRPSPPSSAGSSRSYEQVAKASVNPFSTYGRSTNGRSVKSSSHSTSSTSRSRSPSRLATKPAPPTHPDRRPPSSLANVFDPPSVPPSPNPGTARVGRSKSMHYPSAPPIPPPPRRKRPESFQVVNAPDSASIYSSEPKFSISPNFNPTSRHYSISSHNRGSGDESPMANIQRTLSHLQTVAQPKLDAARYKAEAGLSKRGFVHHTHLNGPGGRWREEGEEALMADSGEGSDPDVDRGLDSAISDQSFEDRRGRIGRYEERDNLKWPAGEGWKPL